MERLGEIGKALSRIQEAVKTMKSIRSSNWKLHRITEIIKRQSYEVKEIDLPQEQQLEGAHLALQELKLCLQKLLECLYKLEHRLKTFNYETSEFEEVVKEKLIRKEVSPSDTAEMCDKIRKTQKIASGFSAAFDAFIDRLGSVRDAASRLTDHLNKKAEEINQQASSKQNLGTAGLVLGGLGFAALGFFTGGIGWAVGAAGAAAAGGLGYNNSVDVKGMRKLANDIVSGANKLDNLVNELDYSCKQAQEIWLDKKALEEALRESLDYFEKVEEKDELLEKQEILLEERDRRIAELEAKLSNLSKR